MNQVDRNRYRPAPKSSEMKCPKCNKGTMRASQKDPKVLVCSCGYKATRVKLS